MAKFEKVKRFENEDVPMPVRATDGAAGYDFFVAENTVVPSLKETMYPQIYNEYCKIYGETKPLEYLTLQRTEECIKAARGKLTLVPTGIKCKLDPGTYLELSVRSSTPLKSWLMLANGVGIIDADYYGNSANDGEIFFQLINLAPWPIKLQKGDRIGQGIIKPYLTTEDDNCTGDIRGGGFGSSEIKK